MTVSARCVVTFSILLLYCVVWCLVSENESEQAAQCEQRVREVNLQSSSVARCTAGAAAV